MDFGPPEFGIIGKIISQTLTEPFSHENHDGRKVTESPWQQKKNAWNESSTFLKKKWNVSCTSEFYRLYAKITCKMLLSYEHVLH